MAISFLRHAARYEFPAALFLCPKDCTLMLFPLNEALQIATGVHEEMTKLQNKVEKFSIIITIYIIFAKGFLWLIF